MDTTNPPRMGSGGAVGANEGMEILDIEFRPEGSRGGRVLRVYLDKDGRSQVWMSSAK